MKKVLISFGSSGYEKGLNSLAQSGRSYFDEVRMYKPSDIDSGFLSANEAMFRCSRGYGYWLWKPYFIQRTLLELSSGDVVFYADSLMNFIANPIDAIYECKNNRGLLAGFQVHLEKAWTTRDCFILMGTDSEEYWNTPQLNASHSIYEKNDLALSVVDEWLQTSKNMEIMADGPTRHGNDFPEFVAHRHDQSILSLLFKKYKIGMHKCLCQWGKEWCETQGFMCHSKYGQIVHHHRAK